MTVQEKVPFHCQRSHFSFLHFNYVQTEVNDAYYNLIVALLSCLWDCEITEKALESSDNASCCAEHYLLICTDITVSGKKQRDLVGSQWEGSMEEKRLEALAVETGDFCMPSIAKEGLLFSFFPFVQACLSHPIPTNHYYHILAHFVILHTNPLFLRLCFSSSLCGLWCLWSSILGSRIPAFSAFHLIFH